MNGRARVRGSVERLATGTGLTRLAERLRPRKAAILAFHNVVRPEDAGRGDASLHLPLPRFLAQIERLTSRYDVVPLDGVPAAAKGKRPRIVITFDDAYRGAIELALPELVRRGLPSTVFVAPGLLGATSTWWDDLGEAGLLAPATRTAALTRHQGKGDRVRRALLGDRPAPALPPGFGIASESELRGAADPLVSFGSHSWRHEHLPSLSGAEIRATLERARDWIETFPGRATETLALPYGGNSPAVTAAALRLGHSAVLEIGGGLWGAGPTDDRVIPRINVPAGMTPRGLELRTSGLFP